MKIALSLIFLAFPSLLFAQARIEFQYNISDAGKTKKYCVPLRDGRFLYLNLATTKADGHGKTVLQLDLKKPGVIYLGDVADPIQIYIEPKSSIAVDLRDTVKFSGSLSKENTMIRKLKRNGLGIALASAQRPKEMLAMEKLGTPSELFKRLDSLVKSGDALIDKLLDEDNISMNFVDYMRADNRMYYNDIAFLAVFYQKFGSYVHQPVAADTTIINSEWGQALTTLAENIFSEVNSNYYETSQAYFNCIFDVIVRYQTGFLKENAVVAEDDSMNRHLTDLFVSAVPYAVQSHLDSRSREFFIPNLLSFYITGNQLYYTNDMLDLYNNFKREFPKSTYVTAMQPRIAEVETAVKPVKQNNSGVQVIKNFQSIDTFDQLVAPYKGKVVFIDVWAMWCGPCVKEFESLGALRDLKSKEKDLEILYLSRDRMSDLERWKQFINKRDLVGQHIIPNANLQGELRALLNWNEIPRYAVLNKNGEFVTNDAPSSGSKEIIELLTKALAENR